MVDGEHVLPMATSQDHKRVGARKIPDRTPAGWGLTPLRQW